MIKEFFDFFHETNVVKNNMLNFNRTESDISANKKLIIISGENASGKSISCRILAKLSITKSFLYKEISMGDRNGKSYFSSVINYGRYGDEDKESTGYLTVYRIIKDLDSLINQSSDNFVFSVDEPELGLGEEYHFALGQLLALRYLDAMKTNRCQLFVIISHSKNIFNGLLSELSFTPVAMFFSMNKTEYDFYHWLNVKTENKTIEQLLDLPEKSKQKRKELAAYIK